MLIRTCSFIRIYTHFEVKNATKKVLKHWSNILLTHIGKIQPRDQKLMNLRVITLLCSFLTLYTHSVQSFVKLSIWFNFREGATTDQQHLTKLIAMLFSLAAAVSLFLSITSLFFWITNKAQKDPYMDEIFHIPQAQQYCNKNYTMWDPMITTLPGLYFASLPLLYPVSLMFYRGNMHSVCTTSLLRSVNVLFALGNLYLLYLISRKLHYNGKNGSQVVLTSLTLAMFPVLYFFSWLYYTDPAATFSALLAYYLYLDSQHFPASLVGVVAILFRQTNILWVIFCAGLTLGKTLMKWLNLDKKDYSDKQKPFTDWLILQRTTSLIFQSVRFNPKELICLLLEILYNVWSYMVVGVCFVVFVIINKGIVVGDRSNHQPCLNIPQLFYFLFVTMFFSFMHMISIQTMKNMFSFVVQSPVKTIVFFIVAFLCIYKFMYIHEYNLADNRHYNFYFLSKIIRRHEYVKYMLIPVYLYAFVTVLNLLKERDIFWKLSYFICTAASIVPQRMIEFRYFIMPYLIFRLNMPLSSRYMLITELLFYVAINAWTVYMYAFKPFPWHNTNELQRFMW